MGGIGIGAFRQIVNDSNISETSIFRLDQSEDGSSKISRLTIAPTEPDPEANREIRSVFLSALTADPSVGVDEGRIRELRTKLGLGDTGEDGNAGPCKGLMKREIKDILDAFAPEVSGGETEKPENETGLHGEKSEKNPDQAIDPKTDAEGKSKIEANPESRPNDGVGPGGKADGKTEGSNPKGPPSAEGSGNIQKEPGLSEKKPVARKLVHAPNAVTGKIGKLNVDANGKCSLAEMTRFLLGVSEFPAPWYEEVSSGAPASGKDPQNCGDAGPKGDGAPLAENLRQPPVSVDRDSGPVLKLSGAKAPGPFAEQSDERAIVSIAAGYGDVDNNLYAQYAEANKRVAEAKSKGADQKQLKLLEKRRSIADTAFEKGAKKVTDALRDRIAGHFAGKLAKPDGTGFDYSKLPSCSLAQKGPSPVAIRNFREFLATRDEMEELSEATRERYVQLLHLMPDALTGRLDAPDHQGKQVASDVYAIVNAAMERLELKVKKAEIRHPDETTELKSTFDPASLSDPEDQIRAPLGKLHFNDPFAASVKTRTNNLSDGSCFFYSVLDQLPGVAHPSNRRNGLAFRAQFQAHVQNLLRRADRGEAGGIRKSGDRYFVLDHGREGDVREVVDSSKDPKFGTDFSRFADVMHGAFMADFLKRPVVILDATWAGMEGKGGEKPEQRGFVHVFDRDLVNDKKLEGEPIVIHYRPRHFHSVELKQGELAKLLASETVE